MEPCDHEEADTRMVIHVQDAAEKGDRHFMIRTVGTDVIVIFIGLFFSLQNRILELTSGYLSGWLRIRG